MKHSINEKLMSLYDRGMDPKQIALETGMSPDAVTRRLAVLRASNRYCRDCMWYDDEHSECLMHTHGEYAVGQEHSCGEWSGGNADGQYL